MNPARCLGSAVVAADLRHLWIYLTAPFLGAVVAAGAAAVTAPIGRTCADRR